MKKNILLGIIASFFFSSTFAINAWISQDGSWYWTATLRYIYVFILLTFILYVSKGPGFLLQCFKIFKFHWPFWLLAGGIGYGCFYLALCYSSAFVPGWIIATTWQLTILASPIVLFAMGKKVPLRGVMYLIIIFFGICLVNFQEASIIPTISLLKSIVPVVFAAFFYPLGNNLCKYAVEGNYRGYKLNKHPELKNSLCQVYLMTIGAMPVLALCGILIRPTFPTVVQLYSTMFIAISTGVIATSIFYYSRFKAKNAFEVAAVDSTQAGEVVFALIIELFFFGGKFPSILGIVGLLFVFLGIILFTFKVAD